MAYSDELAKLSDRVKEAEVHAAAAQDKAKADLERDASTARASSQANAEKLRETAEHRKGQISENWAGVQQKWNEHVATARAKIESKKAEHDVAEAERHAIGADEDASFAIDFAYAAIDEADSAVLDAVLARREADELAARAGA